MIDDYEDEDYLDEEEWEEIDFDDEDEEPDNEIDTDTLKTMIKMTREREKKEQRWALEEREKIIKEQEKLSGPAFFDPKDLYLPQGESI